MYVSRVQMHLRSPLHIRSRTGDVLAWKFAGISIALLISRLFIGGAMEDEQIVVDPDSTSDVSVSNSDESLPDAENQEVDLTHIEEQLDEIIEIHKETVKSQQEITELFSVLAEESTSNIDDDFLTLYKKNSEDILSKLESISGSAVSLDEKMDDSNIHLSNVSNIGIVSICGLGILVGALVMSVFSRYFKH